MPALPPTELTSPVSLTTSDGHFNKAAHGWARQPIVDTSGNDGSTYNGKNRRWEYWCTLTPTHILAFSIALIDFAAPASVWIFDRRTNIVVAEYASNGPLDSVVLPPNVEDGPASARQGDLSVDIEQVQGGTRLRASFPGASFDVLAKLPENHERLAVVVPWDDVLFQYTVKDVTRPAEGSVAIGSETFLVPAGESWSILDHGRGRWPAKVHWNWGAASGRLSDGRVFGLQVGDKWTDGTGSTENSFLLGTKVYKLGNIKWEYDTEDYMLPWRVSGDGLDATMVPFHNKVSRIATAKVKSNTDQAFGIWKGKFDTGDEIVEFQGVVGFAEDVTKEW